MAAPQWPVESTEARQHPSKHGRPSRRYALQLSSARAPSAPAIRDGGPTSGPARRLAVATRDGGSDGGWSRLRASAEHPARWCSMVSPVTRIVAGISGRCVLGG